MIIVIVILILLLIIIIIIIVVVIIIIIPVLIRSNGDSTPACRRRGDAPGLRCCPLYVFFREIPLTTVSTRWPKPKCTIPAWPSQFKIVGC